jgi:hypothetical protein
VSDHYLPLFLRTRKQVSGPPAEGVGVADVAWASDLFLKKYGAPLCFSESPGVVIEVFSPMKDKRRLYFQAGAKEFWLCGEYGDMRFFNPEGEMEKSGLFPEFPRHIEIEVV